MTSMNFAEALSAPISDIVRPPSPPAGSYTFQITKIPKIGELKGKETEFDIIDFPCQAVIASDEVDADELAAFGLKNVQTNLRFMFDRSDDTKRSQSEFRLKTFLEDHCGLQGKSLKELLNNALNARFLGATRLRPDPMNPDIQYFEIAKTAPAE
jgi:hypothetical protein